MSAPLSPDEIERIARKRAGAKLGWYIHATVYVLVNAGLFVLSQSVGHQRRWSIYPALGWGVGLLCHGASVWVLGSGSALRERMVERERERLRQQQR
ncbi:2TM domain-containing protein [Xylophilus sp. GW821-FHT01B05]